MNLALRGNWVDLLILIFLALYALGGSTTGFIHRTISLIGFGLSFLIAVRFYSIGSAFFINNFSLSHGIANALGFLLVAMISETILSFISFLITKRIPKKFTYSPINKLAGFIPSLISSVILAAFILSTALALPIRPDIKHAIVNSKIGSFLSTQTLGIEHITHEIFGGAIKDALTFLTVNPGSSESINLNFTTNSITPDLDSEKSMLLMVNAERKLNSLSALYQDSKLQLVARKHCEDMLARGYFSHNTPEGWTPFDRMNNDKIQYLAAGENLAFAPDVVIAHTGLMKSTGHRENILSKDYFRVGIGVIDAGIYGKMFCQEFTD